jgi:hypothetical protein
MRHAVAMAPICLLLKQVNNISEYIELECLDLKHLEIRFFTVISEKSFEPHTQRPYRSQVLLSKAA